MKKSLLTVAIDTGPLYGAPTGVSHGVEGMINGLRRNPQAIDILPYVLSFRASLAAGTRRLPFPAGLTVRSWGSINRPHVERYLPRAQMIHGMNYVVPPSRLPRLVTVYDCWALQHPEQSSTVVQRSMRALRRAVHTGAVIHASSQATAQTLSHIFPDARIEMIYLGAPAPRAYVDDLARPPGLHTMGTEPFILSVGTIERRKNLPRLIDSFALLCEKVSNICLVIAGADGDDSATLKHRINNLPAKIQDRIVRTGRVSNDNVAWLYQHAHLVVYPSLDEGFGFPLLEAMRYAVPLVGAARGSIPEIAGAAALLVDPEDTQALSDAMLSAVTNDVTRQDLIRAGTTQIQQFSWDETATALIDLYDDLVNHR